jgi:hypothetical protein
MSVEAFKLPQSTSRNVSLCRRFHRFQQPVEDDMAIEADEQGNLIGNDKVEGSTVYGADNTKIGSIERLMIEKVSGKVSYAVLSFGGFLGIGDDHYPLPWHSLSYDTGLDGYVTNLTESQLKGAPKYENENAWNWDDRKQISAVDDYYRL